MTQIKNLRKLPYVDITVRFYRTSTPYKKTKKSSQYYATFTYEGSTVSVDGKQIADISSPMGGGMQVMFHAFPDPSEPGHSSVYFMPADDVFNSLLEAIGWTMPDPALLQDEYRVQKEPKVSVSEHERNEPDEDDEEFEKIQAESEHDRKILAEGPEENEAPTWREGDPYWEPQYPGPHGLSGGNLIEVPEPHVRYWPKAFEYGKKREVRLRIMRYYGQGIHYFVGLDEEDNPIWDGRKRDYGDDDRPFGWRECWDDKEGEGRSESDFYQDLREANPGDKDRTFGEFLSYWDAKRFLEMLLAKYFPPEQYEYNWNDDYCKDWEPKHEGD